MTIFDSMNVSASGLRAQRTRVNAASSNLANANSTRGPDGKPYQRLDPVFEAEADSSTGQPGGVRVAEMRADQSEGRSMYMPDHPDANGDGFVTLPNVDPVHEIVNLMSAQRGFEANATAFETAKTLAQRALDIMRS
ncbi:MAG: flagellar basal body rod protein FlgC [Deltaproteobacteria bacterium]|nr:flagellar basal body rod protein FlgC [Deltaproteobacteria bacterium]